ncbi:MAG: leucyl aminopeptidase [Nitrospiraceae bacterium]
MITLQAEVKPGRLEQESMEMVVVTHFEGEPVLKAEAAVFDRALGGVVLEVVKSGEFEGKLGETLLLHTHGKVPAKRLLLVGLGKKKEFHLDALRQAYGYAVKRVRQAKTGAFAASLPPLVPRGATTVDLVRAMTEGVILGSYQFTEYRSENNGAPKQVARFLIVTSDKAQFKQAVEGVRRGTAAAEAAVLTRDLCNHPSNVMTPTRIAEEAKAIAKESGVSLKILEREEMEELGMGALLGVARGSHEPPKFIILEYRGPKTPKESRPIVLIGKTITFDTGGISLKPADNMEQMKADMTGGAEVLATLRAVARLRLSAHVVGMLPVAENMPGGRAMKPGDIVKTLSGKTVEVQNTDAEGRLILADALAYAARYKPSAVIDIATLTGACVVALGQFAIGMFGTNDGLKRRVQAAGQKSGERVWEMPLWDDYFEQLKSDVADMRNIGGRGGGMITAALFLSKFATDYPWVHLDIASTDWSERERAYIPKGPTGIGTRLLLQYVMDQAR